MLRKLQFHSQTKKNENTHYLSTKYHYKSIKLIQGTLVFKKKNYSMKLPNNISSRYHKDVLNDTLLLCFSKPTFSFDKTC